MYKLIAVLFYTFYGENETLQPRFSNGQIFRMLKGRIIGEAYAFKHDLLYGHG